MKHIYSIVLIALTGVFAFGQTTYLVNGPVNGQGPLLNTEDSGTSTGWVEIHPETAGGGASVNSWSAAQVIPFPFEFYGTAVTQFCVSKNYLLTFDASVAGTTLNASVTTDNSSMPNADLPNNTIAYLWGGFGDPAPIGTNDDVWMRTFGTAPNRQLWIKNYSYEYEAQSFTYNYVVLEETTNKIYVVDVRWATQGVGTYTVGVQQNSTTAVQHASSPNIASINGNITTWTPSSVYYYEFTPFVPSTEDAFVASIDAPTLPSCTANSNVVVTIGSNGSNDLTSVTINWAVNGVLQTPFAWTGSLPQFGTSSGNIIGNYTFSDGDLLEVWTSNPNAATDGDTSNDTTSLTINFGLSGTYLIGATGDYPTFSAAVADITAYGVCGSVIFDVMPGTYNEQITITEVVGMDATNNVTFRSLSGDSTSVELTYAGLGTTDNYVIWFNGGDYFTFEQMTIKNNTTLGYGRVLSVEGNSTNNTFQNCIIEGDLAAASTSTNLSTIYSASGAPSNDSYWTFNNNRILGGSYGVYWYGESSAPYQEVGTVFTNNSFENNYYRASRLYYQDSPTFSGNTATVNSGYTTGFDVFYFGYCDSSLVVTNNNAYLNGLYGDGISIYYCEGSSTAHALVANNQVTIDAGASTSTTYGIYLTNSDFPDVYHNSVYMMSQGTSSRGIYSVSGIQNAIMNNSVYNAGPGYAVYYGSGSVGSSDYNNLYAPNGSVGYLGAAWTTLADWQAASAMDGNSINVDPMYTALGDLHTCSPDLDNAGFAVSSVTTDVDGEMRSMTTPDIGVDEFFDPASFTLGMDTTKCVGQPVTLGSNIHIPSATYLWSDGSTTDMITVTTAGQYAVAVTGACGVAEDTVMVNDILLPTAGFTQANSFLTAILTDQSTAAIAWEWNFGDGNTSTLQNPIHVYDQPGTYTITQIVIGECGNDTITQSFTASVVGLHESEMGSVSVYPNPAVDELNINFSNWAAGDATIIMIDLSGKQLLSEKVMANHGDFTQMIDVSQLERGMYMIVIQSENATQLIQKFEKQ